MPDPAHDSVTASDLADRIPIAGDDDLTLSDGTHAGNGDASANKGELVVPATSGNAVDLSDTTVSGPKVALAEGSSQGSMSGINEVLNDASNGTSAKMQSALATGDTITWSPKSDPKLTLTGNVVAVLSDRFPNGDGRSHDIPSAYVMYQDARGKTRDALLRLDTIEIKQVDSSGRLQTAEPEKATATRYTHLRPGSILISSDKNTNGEDSRHEVGMVVVGVGCYTTIVKLKVRAFSLKKDSHEPRLRMLSLERARDASVKTPSLTCPEPLLQSLLSEFGLLPPRPRLPKE